ncbi:MAG TPA: zinc-binding dehydrogenase [Gemmatimonadaceae bacterium]|nr:zinc-binding dehydrogenase [Gemmatimonadaceae bacterium]
MRALTISALGGLDKLEYRTDLPIPEVGAGQVRVRIKAAALNHLDLFMLEGLPGITLRPPWIMGADGTGTIDAIGENANTRCMIGDRVIINPGISDGTCEYCRAGEQSLCIHFGLLGEHHPGTLAEYICIPATNVRRIPETISDEDAAAYTLAALTARRMVVTRANVTPNDDVLIWGIGGGVALAALQLVKQIGARAWVTSSSDEKLERARELGADETLNYKKLSVGREIRARTGKRGVSVVLDNVGKATWNESLIALGRRGRLVTCGATSGPIVETDVRRLFWNQWSIMGSTMGNDTEFDAVAKDFSAGRLRPIIDSVYDLENGRDAFARLKGGEQFGKIVVRVA